MYEIELPCKIGQTVLDGCDINFIATAPADITLEQLLNQTSRIRPDWCACGIRYLYKTEAEEKAEIEIGYDYVRKINEEVSCTIIDDLKWRDKYA